MCFKQRLYGKMSPVGHHPCVLTFSNTGIYWLFLLQRIHISHVEKSKIIFKYLVPWEGILVDSLERNIARLARHLICIIQQIFRTMRTIFNLHDNLQGTLYVPHTHTDTHTHTKKKTHTHTYTKTIGGWCSTPTLLLAFARHLVGKWLSRLLMSAHHDTHCPNNHSSLANPRIILSVYPPQIYGTVNVKCR